MSFGLRLFSRFAYTANTLMAMTIIATNQLSKESGNSSIVSAIATHNRLFFVYMVLVVMVAVFTYLVWQSGNRVQGAIQSDADARIKEAQRGASEADAKAASAGDSAAKANEKAKQLENDNLKLRTDLDKESGKVAGLQKLAADAITSQHEVE